MDSLTDVGPECIMRRIGVGLDKNTSCNELPHAEYDSSDLHQPPIRRLVSCSEASTTNQEIAMFGEEVLRSRSFNLSGPAQRSCVAEGTGAISVDLVSALPDYCLR